MTFTITNFIPLHASYNLTLPFVPWPVSIFSLQGQEILNQPWCCELIFTSPCKSIPKELVLCQKATLNFKIPSFIPLLSRAQSDQNNDPSRQLTGIVTEFTFLKVNKQEAYYRIVLKPKLALLDEHKNSAIYQHKSVIEVTESLLKRHGFSGSEYRFELQDVYPKREFITQWEETDLTFMRRILADVGIWIRFKYLTTIQKECVIISDNVNGYADAGSLPYRDPNGMTNKMSLGVWGIQMHSALVESAVKMNEYNYLKADTPLACQVSDEQSNDLTHGLDYRWGEKYNEKGDRASPESGYWYAVRRHQACLTKQHIIQGKTNDYRLAPGQLLRIDSNSFGFFALSEGIVILSVDWKGDRSQAFELDFTAIPYNTSRPYRPELLPIPEIYGTVPATIMSPDNGTYSYLDIQGRYQVKFDFDSTELNKENENVWLRLAKPYGGNQYGFHFPLLTGTEVAIAFTGGDPNRPYIAHAMHNSRSTDMVTAHNKHSNVVQTPANNTLRMDDKRGEEHITLETEFSKSQLNLGHLIDNKKEKRGFGFELRTDNYGAIAANRGIYLTTDKTKSCKQHLRDMPLAQLTLDNSLEISKEVDRISKQAGVHTNAVNDQTNFKQTLTRLNQNALVIYGKEGTGIVSEHNVQLSAGRNLTMAAEKNINMSVQRKLVISVEEALSLLAHRSGLKLFANQENVDIAAQNDELSLHAEKNLLVESTLGRMKVAAAKEILLISGDSYIKISEAGIEMGSPGSVRLKSAGMEKLGPVS